MRGREEEKIRWADRSKKKENEACKVLDGIVKWIIMFKIGLFSRVFSSSSSFRFSHAALCLSHFCDLACHYRFFLPDHPRVHLPHYGVYTVWWVDHVLFVCRRHRQIYRHHHQHHDQSSTQKAIIPKVIKSHLKKATYAQFLSRWRSPEQLELLCHCTWELHVE